MNQKQIAPGARVRVITHELTDGHRSFYGCVGTVRERSNARLWWRVVIDGRGTGYELFGDDELELLS